MKMKRDASKLFIHLFLFLGVVIMILPFVWMILTSFKTVSESTSMNPYVIFHQSGRLRITLKQ